MPSAVLTSNATVLAANDQFEALKGPFRIGAFDRLSLVNAATNGLFGTSSPASANARRRSNRFPARRDEASLIVHVTPIARTAHDIFDQAACIVIVTRIGGVNVPDGAMLNGLFDLSPRRPAWSGTWRAG